MEHFGSKNGEMVLLSKELVSSVSESSLIPSMIWLFVLSDF